MIYDINYTKATGYPIQHHTISNMTDRYRK